MLECDDDDDVFEEADAEAFAAREEAAAAADATAADPDDDSLLAEAPLSLEDFNLLPRVLQLLDAHQAGEGIDTALSELQRALKRCEAGVARCAAEAATFAAVGGSAVAQAHAREALVARTRLLSEQRKRTHDELGRE